MGLNLVYACPLYPIQLFSGTFYQLSFLFYCLSHLRTLLHHPHLLISFSFTVAHFLDSFFTSFHLFESVI